MTSPAAASLESAGGEHRMGGELAGAGLTSGRPASGELAEPFSDDELAELAMAADPDAPLDAEAVPLSVFLGRVAPMVSGLPMLPPWYMPPASTARASRWRTVIVLAIVVALIAIDAWGLCSTYGSVVPA
jgi:hypothetical protein